MNEKVIRYADVLLMCAEAHALSGNDARARTLTNRVRSRVGLQPLNSSGAALVDAIYRERRMELATEGHRFFDLVRSGRAVEFLGPLGFTANKNEVLPLPQVEIDISNGVIKQNNNY
ncbi:MAG: RagB/SusD family nutrient uptake outer membrane protein [Saprospiraceae bacterium]|jgi:starch-binding outer membrane protein, SusD/RagB family|nr:RagB/SusD family nutrient uptake outer membrane protein [Saprospiraceae bacterium]